MGKISRRKRSRQGRTIVSDGEAAKPKSKKANPQRNKALWCLLNLIRQLPLNLRKEWVTADELRKCLVRGGVSPDVEESDVRDAIGKLEKHAYQIDEFGKKKTKYYRHISFNHISATPDTRQGPDYALPSIETGCFLSNENHVADINAIQDYINSRDSVAAPSKDDLRGGSDEAPATVTPCRGWSGPRYADVVFLSMEDYLLKRRESGDGMKAPSGRIPLAGLFSERKDYNNIEVDVSASSEAVIRASECLGSSNGKLCDVCKVVSRSLAYIKRQASPDIDVHGRMHITPERILLMGPNKTAAAVQSVRTFKNDEIRGLRQKVKRYEENCVNADTVLEVEHCTDMEVLQQVANEALPIAAKILGEDSIRYHVFASSLQHLQGKRYDKNGNVSTGVRYNPETFTYALTMLRDYKTRAYESLAETLYLPTARHLRDSMREIVGDNDDGAQINIIKAQHEVWSEWAQKNPTKSEGWNQVSVSYDSMKICPGMVLMRRVEQKNRIQGAILPESMNIATRLFDQFVFKVADERGLGPGDEDQMETVADLLVLNSEHSVYYAVSMNPHCKMCFIAGMYNSPTLTGEKLSSQLDDVTRALAKNDMYKRVEVSDSAGSNEGYANEWYDIPASQYIPSHVLAKHGLDGKCMVAYEFYVDSLPVFGFDDPPHVLKRVGNAMRNRPLEWTDGYPMTIGVLGDVYQADCLHEDQFAFKRERGLTPSLFDENVRRDQKMKVAPTAKVLSNKMVRTIDRVCKDPMIHFSNLPFGQRANVLAPVRKLCKEMNHWFDLCNSKDPENRDPDHRVWVTPRNGAKIADEFLSTLKWLQDWRDSLTVNGRLQKKYFLPDETYLSLQRCCYGFASMIYYWVLGKGQNLLLNRINQDMCEHHFGHLRAAGGHCIKPSEPCANAGGKTSGLKRTVKASESANVTLDLKRMRLD